MKYSIKSPTRVDFAGGTLDCWPLYLLVPGCQTINLSLSISTFVELEPRTDSQIRIEVVDLGFIRNFSHLDELLADTSPELQLLQAHLAHFRPTLGFVLRTRSESPVGGGLGGSSSLCISLIKAFSSWLDLSLTAAETVQLAANLEAQVLRKPTGTQDYFPALKPGLGLIEYGPWGFRHRLLPFPKDLFAECMTLVYTGQPHHSGLNNWQVIKAAVEGEARTLRCLEDLRTVAQEMGEACVGGHWGRLPQLFDREFEGRIALSEAFVSSEILRLKELALKQGADAVKICGAGGGGCVMIWSSSLKKASLWEACQQEGFQPLAASPVTSP